MKKAKLMMAVIATSLYAMGAHAGIKVEAETFSGEGGGAVSKVGGRPGASGECLTSHNDKGHWLEWKVEVAEAGDYELTLRYAGGRKWTVGREVTVNGKSPAGWDKLSLPTTGGFGRAESEWKNITLPGTVKLEKGSNVIRINNLGAADGDGAANLDLLWFGKPGEAPSL